MRCYSLGGKTFDLYHSIGSYKLIFKMAGLYVYKLKYTMYHQGGRTCV